MTEERQPTRFTVWKCSKCGYEATQPFTRQHLTNTYRYCGEAPEKTDLVPAADLDKALAALREIARQRDGAVVALGRIHLHSQHEWSREVARAALKDLDGLREPA